MDNKILDFALRVAQRNAQIGKPSYFDKWWYFDTNCASEIVKLYLGDFQNEVEKFIFGKDILLTTTSFVELRRAPSILDNILKAFNKANVYLAPDISKFWYSDFINFLNDDKNPIEFNSLNIQLVQPALIEQVLSSKKSEIDKASKQFYLDIDENYSKIVQPDIGQNYDERDLCIHIKNKIREYGKKWFNLEIPTSDSNSVNFPSFYVFYYAYYYRYSKNRDIKVDLNDVVDLENCMALPYCERYFCEASFSVLLSKNVKGLIPPTAYNISKRLYKKGYLDKKIFDVHKKKRKLLSQTGPLLVNTEISSFREMRNQILGGKSLV